MNTLEDFMSVLDRIQGLPAGVLVVISCIAIGYALRYIKSFPNQAIPVVVILWGALMMLFIADPRPTTMSPRIWTARNLAVGLALGLLAWFIHAIAISRLENYLVKKFGGTPLPEPPNQDPTLPPTQ